MKFITSNYYVIALALVFFAGLNAVLEVDIPKARLEDNINFELKNNTGKPMYVTVRSNPNSLNSPVRYYLVKAKVNSVVRLGGKQAVDTSTDVAVIIYPGPLDLNGNPTVLPFVITNLRTPSTLFLKWDGKNLTHQLGGGFGSRYTTSGLPLRNNITQRENIVKLFGARDKNYFPKTQEVFYTHLGPKDIPIPDYKDIGPAELLGE